MMLDVEGDTPEELRARRRPCAHQAAPTRPDLAGSPSAPLLLLRRLTAGRPCAAQEWEEEDEDDEKTEITNYDVGEEALDRISIGRRRHRATRRPPVPRPCL